MTNSVIVTTNAAKKYIQEAIVRISKDKGIFPALDMIHGFDSNPQSDKYRIKFSGKCFGISGHVAIHEGYRRISLSGHKLIAHEMVLGELQGRILDLVTIVNYTNGREQQTLMTVNAV